MCSGYRLRRRFSGSSLLVAIFVIVVPGQTRAAPAPAEGLPTPEQLVSLIQASKDRYRSFDLETQVSRYLVANGKRKSEPEDVSKITWRWIPEGQLVHESIVTAGSDKPIPRTLAITSKWAKLLEEKHGKPAGIVDRPHELEPFIGLNAAKAMWRPLHPDQWSFVKNDKGTVERQAERGTWVLKAQVSDDGTSYVIEVDAAKGYLPVRSEVRGPDGTFLYGAACSDFRQLEDGLWLPFSYTWSVPTRGENVYHVSTARVNVPLNEDDVNFSFPSGCMVNDRILHIKYQIDNSTTALAEMKGEPLPAELSAASVAAAPVIPVAAVPVKDEALDAAAARARNLAVAQTYGPYMAAGVAGIVLAAIGVRVWKARRGRRAALAD